MNNAIISAFQKELKQKLQFKASPKVSSDALLFKAFRFFDLNNNGHLSKSEFFKAIAKCGMVVDTHHFTPIFNHYDLQNTTSIDYKNFIEKLLFSQKSSNENLQDSQPHRRKNSVTEQKNSTYINHKQQNQHKNEKSEGLSNQSPFSKLKQIDCYNMAQNYEQTIEALTSLLRKDGIYGLLKLANQLKQTDLRNTHLISANNMRQCLSYLSQSCTDEIIDHYNPNELGEINYAELIYDLKDNMNTKRQSAITELFTMLDVHQRSEIQISKLSNSFRNRTQISTFQKTIDLYCQFQNINDGVFTDQDVNDFFGFISFSFINDQDFHNFIQKGFYSEKSEIKSTSSNRLRVREFNPLKQVSINRDGKSQNKVKPLQNHEQQKQQLLVKQKQPQFEKEIENNSQTSVVKSRRGLTPPKSCISEQSQIKQIFSRVKKTLISKGTKGFLQFEKQLKANDADSDGKVTFDQFKRVIYDQKVGISTVEASQIFNSFDQQKSGFVTYEQILQNLRGEIPQKRLNMISRMWQKVKVDEKHTSFQKIKVCLNFRLHPDIQAGRRDDQQIWREIQQTILLIQELSGTARSDTVCKDDFEEYCVCLSLSIRDDQLFESVAQNFWKVGSINTINNSSAGWRKTINDHRGYGNSRSAFQNAPFGTFDIPTSYITEHQKL